MGKSAGFCYRVREAVRTWPRWRAQQASDAQPRPGRPQEGVIQDLETLGIETVDTLDDVVQGAAVVIRAPGTGPTSWSARTRAASR